MKLNELIISENKTELQNEFLEVHNKILSAGMLISANLIELAKNLKKMRDDKLYLQAECETFEEYAEQVCGLKRSQAFKYISVIENLGEDFVHSSGQIGITKLSLLASLSQEEKNEVIETVAVEDVSVSKLKEEIKKLKCKNSDLVEKKGKIEEQCQELKGQILMFENNKQELPNEERESLESEIEDLKSQIEELKNSPAGTVEVYVENPETKQKLEETKNLLKENKEKLKHLEEYKSELEKKLEITNSKELTEFKIRFEELQNMISRVLQLIQAIPEDKREGCRNALKKVGEQLC